MGLVWGASHGGCAQAETPTGDASPGRLQRGPEVGVGGEAARPGRARCRVRTYPEGKDDSTSPVSGQEEARPGHRMARGRGRGAGAASRAPQGLHSQNMVVLGWWFLVRERRGADGVPFSLDGWFAVGCHAGG